MARRPAPTGRSRSQSLAGSNLQEHADNQSDAHNSVRMLSPPHIAESIPEDDDESEGEGSEAESTYDDNDSASGTDESATDSDGESYRSVLDLQHDDNPIPNPNPNPPQQEIVELREETDQHGNRVYIEEYPVPTAGAPIRPATEAETRRGNYPDVGQLSDTHAFEIARVLMLSGMSANYRNQYLRLKKLRNQMPWPNNRALMKDLDKLPHGAGWTVQALSIEGNIGVEIVEMWMRDALEIVKQLLRNKRLGKFIRWKPIKKWTSPDRTEQIRDELYTADWMWEVQGEIEDEDGTIISIIISSDETRLTNFSGDKKAHPVYLTIGNLPKRLRRRTSKRANILLGYLPVPKLNCETNVEARRYHRRNLFHTCMRALMAPLAEACETGVEVPCADGHVRRIYPVLAAYIADFPEQCKIACIKQTHCPVCTVHPKKKGDLGDAPLRTHDGVTEAIDAHQTRGSAKFERLGLYGVEPFWKDFPYLRLGCLMTPDLLHQLHKGVMKDHLTRWVAEILGKDVLDERHITMPEYHGMRHFKNGISTVSQWTGRELKEMAKVLLPIISDATDRRVITAARALLDFMYLSHSSSLTDTEIRAMEEALRTFHLNKAAFRHLPALQTREAFHGIPKLHAIQHYAMLIRMLGTPDGYNTETSERLHIDFAKLGYRASNRVNAMKQMALYIQRTEAIAMHEEYLAERQGRAVGRGFVIPELGLELEGEEDEEWDEWQDEEEEVEDPDELNDAGVRQELAIALDEFLDGKRARVGGRWVGEPRRPGDADQGPQRLHPVPEIVTAKTPTNPHIAIANLERQHDAPRLHDSLQLYLRKTRPDLSAPFIRETVPDTTKVQSWSRARLFHSPPPFKPSEGPHIDVVRAQPVRIDRYRRVSRPARFDTVLIRNWSAKGVGIHQYRPARVRAIFRLPERLHPICDVMLVYVELFNDPSERPVAPTDLFTTTRSLDQNGLRSTAVVPLSDVALTCHLTPRYRLFHPDHPLLQYSDVLQLCEKFFVNIFATYFLYELFRHWGQEAGGLDEID